MDETRRHRACNACRSRKVRCIPGAHKRCRECEHLNLCCEYLKPASRTKRSGRGTAIESCKPSQRLANGAMLRPLQSNGDLQDSTSISPSSPLRNEDHDYFVSFLPDYEAFVYPFYPVITPSEAKEAIAAMDHNREAQAFVYAMCAATISLAHTIEIDAETIILRLLSESTAALPGVLSVDDITPRRIVLIDFIHMTLAGLGRYEAGFHYLQQSISMVETLKLSDLRTVEHLSISERARRQRLFHLIYVHERYWSLFHRHRISMVSVSWLPDFDDTIPEQVSRGFNQIISLFRHIDVDMINAWLAATEDAVPIDPAWIQKKHRDLEEEPAGSTGLAGLWPMQQADLIITKHWISMLLWQISLSRHFLSTSSDEQIMSLLYPVGVSMQLRALIGQVSRREISIHGSGIQQKLFELTDVMASVVLTMPNIDTNETRQRIDDFRFLFEFWKTLPRLNATQRSILQDKDDQIRVLAT